MSELSDMERGDLEEAYSPCAVTLANREAESAELRRQRDALLAACKVALDDIFRFKDAAIFGETMDMLETAIALAEGEE